MKTNRKRLLIVDDDRDALDSLKLLLEFIYDVCLADTGAEALAEIARGFRPDAVLLDLMMPTMDGPEVAREMRQAGYRAPILVISADPEASSKATAIGAELLRKPFTYEQLKAKLEQVLGGGTPHSGGGLNSLRGFFLALPIRLGGG